MRFDFFQKVSLQSSRKLASCSDQDTSKTVTSMSVLALAVIATKLSQRLACQPRRDSVVDGAKEVRLVPFSELCYQAVDCTHLTPHFKKYTQQIERP